MKNNLKTLSVSKLVLAFLAFALVIFTFTWVSSKEIRRKFVSEKTLSKSDDYQYSKLFYLSIGHSPKTKAPLRSKNLLMSKKKFTLAIRTLHSKSKANKLLRSLNKKGIQAYYSPINKEGHVVYHVRTGVYNSQKQASKAQKDLRKKKKIFSHVTRLF